MKLRRWVSATDSTLLNRRANQLAFRDPVSMLQYFSLPIDFCTYIEEGQSRTITDEFTKHDHASITRIN